MIESEILMICKRAFVYNQILSDLPVAWHGAQGQKHVVAGDFVLLL